MFKSPAMRLSVALVLLMANLLFLANLLGFVPDETKSTLEMRKALSESLALQFSVDAEKGDFQTIQNVLRSVVERNKDIRSAAVRGEDGQLFAIAGEHLAHWQKQSELKSTPTHVHVPIFRHGRKWATVEIRFVPLWNSRLVSGFSHSFIGLLLFTCLSCFLCFFLVIRRTLRELDPAAVIPERVQKAFDSLHEGVLILDDKEQIVMTNKSFAALLKRAANELIGVKGSELGWLEQKAGHESQRLPWLRILHDGLEQKFSLLRLKDPNGAEIKLAVNATAIKDSSGHCRGSLVSFDDITELEEKNYELSTLVEKLQLNHEEIQAKSQELEFLANRDPLTLCLNRRSLDRKFDVLFKKAINADEQLSCLMFDIDFFKNVNDRYGHATGDQVIKSVAEELKATTREQDLVGRYGGEEFCVILPGIDLPLAARLAEKIRKKIERKSCGGVKVTVSTGVSSLEQKASKPDELVNQADKALYAAKKSGRNRVICWEQTGSQDIFSAVGDRGKVLSLVRKAGETEPATTGESLKARVEELEGLLEKCALERQHFEMYDIKTGLPTRSLFEDRIAHEIARSRRKEYLVVVMTMNIETIKRVAESLGQGTAEQLVRACGNRMNDVLRENIDTVALLEEGDSPSSISQINQTEFGVLLTEIKQVDHVTWVIKRLLDAFAKPFQIRDQEIYTSPYVGVSIFPYDGQTAEDLYASSASACSYAEKLGDSNRYQFSSPEINSQAKHQLMVESCLHRAISQNELELHFQPQLETASGRVLRFEVLLRWNSRHLGLVPPEQFIPIAEQSGQINEIGEWVLDMSCRQLRHWLDQGYQVAALAVNLSGVQLRQRNLAQKIEGILARHNLLPEQLELELTESALIHSFDKAHTMLKKIKELGVAVTMDDFGTGYSSLAYLKDIPISCLKIDRSFIADIGHHHTAEKLVTSIVSMAHGLDLKVVAEGVEEKDQADFMTALDCELLQGYQIGRPEPADTACRHLSKTKLMAAASL